MNTIFITHETEPHELSAIAELVIANGFTHLQDGNLTIYEIVHEEGAVLGLGQLSISATLDLLESEFPDGIPGEFISDEVKLFLLAECTCDESIDSPEPEVSPIPKDQAASLHILDVISNTLTSKEFAKHTPQVKGLIADTLLTLAQTRASILGAN